MSAMKISGVLQKLLQGTLLIYQNIETKKLINFSINEIKILYELVNWGKR